MSTFFYSIFLHPRTIRAMIPLTMRPLMTMSEILYMHAVCPQTEQSACVEFGYLKRSCGGKATVSLPAGPPVIE